MKKLMTLHGFCICAGTLSCLFFFHMYGLSIVEGGLAEFVNRVVCPGDQESFKSYYNERMLKLAHNKGMKDRELIMLREGACNALAVKKPEWAQELKLYPYYEHTAAPSQIELENVRNFLTRYGVYEEFLAYKAKTHASLWNRFTSRIRQVKLKVVGWFSTPKNQEKAT